MSSTFNRRSFLTHSATTIGGVALAGSVVDDILAPVAGAATGIGVGTPKIGGTLRVGLLSEQSSSQTFSGSQGKLDSAGFTLANTVFDPLFVTPTSGKGWLPYLALSATPNANYTAWTIVLRRGVQFHDGTPFNAAAVVANYKAAAANATVGLGIAPLIKDVTQPNPADNYTVLYTLQLPYTTFPVNLSEQQIAYMAAPSALASPSNPIGTGPFKYKSWILNETSTWVKNPKYWRKDAAGRKLPYLNEIEFKVIVDDTARFEALQSGSIDMMLTEAGPVIKQMLNTPGIVGITGEAEARDPASDCIMLNVAGKDYTGQSGAVNPSTLQYDHSMRSVLTDIRIRQACAYAINRNQYLAIVDGGVGFTMNGIYRPNSPFYKNPGYPSYNPAEAKKLVAAYKKSTGASKVSFVLDIVGSSSEQITEFEFIQSQLKAVGIEITSRPLQQSVQINGAIFKTYEAVTWNQFGGTEPSLNYVWFSAGNFLNFAQNSDAVLTNAMHTAMAAKPYSASYISNWAKVNTQLAKDIPYLFMAATVYAWGAKKSVQNWAKATAADGKTTVLNPDAGGIRLTETWIS
jgi:peptide/nickel transport system substrate-binding protein